MFSQSDDEQLGLVLGLVFALAAGVVALVIGVAIERKDASTIRLTPAALVLPPPVVAAAPTPVAPTALVLASPQSPAQAAADAASITVEYGVVKFYFASGNAELAPGAREALVDVVRGARGGKKVLISGFHDVRGNAERNAELARQRALAVRDALKSAGVADSQISLQKPAQAAGSGNDAEARRVEIALQ